MLDTVKEYILYNNGRPTLVGRKLGTIFFKKVAKSKHFFRSAKAWGIDLEVFKQAEKDGCNTVMIRDTENKVDYTVSFETFNKHGFVNSFANYGQQIFLSDNYFSVKSLKQDEFDLEG